MIQRKTLKIKQILRLVRLHKDAYPEVVKLCNWIESKKDKDNRYRMLIANILDAYDELWISHEKLKEKKHAR